MSLETDLLPIRACPSCGSEFQPHVLECLDCGTATVAAWEGMTDGIGKGSEAAGDFPGPSADSGTGRFVDPVEDLQGFDVLLRSGDVSWLRPLLARLNREGVETRVVAPPEERRPLLSVLVRREDEERARKIDLKVYLKQVPDLPGSLNRGTVDACPACGTRIHDRTHECPECGLVIWEADEREPGDEPLEPPGGDEGSVVPPPVKRRP